MAARKVENEDEARRCIAAARATRGGLAAWAKAHGIDGRSLNAWRVNLERRGLLRRRAARPRLVELVPARATAVAARYVLRLRDVTLELGDDFSEQTLRRLVSVLKSC